MCLNEENHLIIKKKNRFDKRFQRINKKVNRRERKMGKIGQANL